MEVGPPIMEVDESKLTWVQLTPGPAVSGQFEFAPDIQGTRVIWDAAAEALLIITDKGITIHTSAYARFLRKNGHKEESELVMGTIAMAKEQTTN